MTVAALQIRQIGGLQAPALPLQAGIIPATTATQIDMNAIINMMMMMMVMVMMMKMMAGATAKI